MHTLRFKKEDSPSRAAANRFFDKVHSGNPDSRAMDVPSDIKGACVPSLTENDRGGVNNPAVTTAPMDPAIQRVGTMTTDALASAMPDYLQELSSVHAPGMWDYTNAGAFAVTHKGRKNALGMDDATYDPAILKTKERTNFWNLFGKYHFSHEIDLSSPQLKTDLYGRDCSNAANYLMHYKQGSNFSYGQFYSNWTAKRSATV